MSGNRMKLKKGLFLGMLLSTTFFGYGLEKEQVEALSKLTANTDAWTHRLCAGKDKLADLLRELLDIINTAHAQLQTIPDVPPADSLLKTMIKDLHDGLKATYTTFSKAKSLTDLNKSGSASCSLEPIIKKADKDLDILISHVKAHPDMYTPEALKALETYQKTTFKQFADYWAPKGWAYFLPGIMRTLRRG